jgi:hypothetical protein
VFHDRDGVLLAVAREFSLDCGSSVMVGDTEAGAVAGGRTAFVDDGHDERRPMRCDRQVISLADAAAWILAGVAI